MRNAWLASSSASLLFLACGCEVLQPAKPPPEPQPGTFLSTPFPDVRSLNDVIVLKPGLAYAVGTGGTILKLTGTTWSKEDSGVTDNLESISGFLKDAGSDTETEVMLACGFNGVVLQRTDPGAWAVVPSGTTNVLFSVAVRSETDGFVVGDAGTVLRWDGTQLVDQTTQTLQLVVGLTCSVDTDCGGGSVCNGGTCNSFFPIPEPLKGVGGGSTMLAVGARGAVYSFDADGDPVSGRWQREDSGTTRPLAGIFTESGVWMPATDGVLLFRNGADDYDDESFRTPAPVFLQDVWVDGGNIFAVGLGQDIFHRDGSGAWSLTTVAEDAEMRGIDGFEAPPDDDPKGDPIATFIAVGGGGRIVRGPFVLPVDGESVLSTRLSDTDFVSP